MTATTPRTLLELSKALLVACDASYFDAQHPAPQILAPLPDNTSTDPAYQDGRIYADRPQFAIPDGYSFYDKIERSDIGAKLVIYRNAATNDVIVAFGGTDGIDAQDWTSNTQNLGWNQWQAVKSDTFLILSRIQDQFGLQHINFTGQSLGGALAQYAAYDYVKLKTTPTPDQPVPAFDKSTITLTTFNGLGAQTMLEKMDAYDSSILDGLGGVAHYVVSTDLVSRLGGGHVGAEGKVVYLDGWNYQSGEQVGKPMDIVDSHRIETAFYTHLDASASALAMAPCRTEGSSSFKLLDTPSSVKWAGILGNLMNNESVGPVEAVFRFVMGVEGGILMAPADEIDKIAQEFLTIDHDAGKIGDGAYNFLHSLNLGIVGKIAIFNKVGAGLYLGSLVGSLFTDAIDGIGKVFKGVGNWIARAFTDAPTLPSIDTPASEAEAIARLQGALSSEPEAFKNPEDKARAQAILDKLGGVPCTATLTQAIATGGADWPSAGALALCEAFMSAPTYLALSPEERGKALDDGLLAYQGLIMDAALRTKDATMIAQIDHSMENFYSNELVPALQALNPDFLHPGNGTLQIAGLDGFAETTAFTLGVFGRIGDLFAALKTDGTQTEEIDTRETQTTDAIASCGDALITLTGNGTCNPFDGDLSGLSPNRIETGDIKEGALLTLTAYTPFPAGSEGQTISFHLTGTAANKFVYVEGADNQPLDSSGDFTIEIPPGARQVTFALWAREDVDSSETLGLNGQFTDANGTPTHAEHVEVNLTLTALDETDTQNRPTVSSTPDNSDWLTDNGAAMGMSDAIPNPDGGPVEFAGSDKGEFIWRSYSSDVVNASGGNDRVGTGLYPVIDGPQSVSGGEGDDMLYSFEGAGGVLKGDAGNDLLNAGTDRFIGWRTLPDADHPNGTSALYTYFNNSQLTRVLGDLEQVSFHPGAIHKTNGDVSMGESAGSWITQTDGSILLDYVIGYRTGSGHIDGFNVDHSPWSADFSYDATKNILTVITSDYRNIPAELRNQELRFEWVSRFDDEILVPANPADTPTLTLDGGEGDDALIANDAGTVMIGAAGLDMILGGKGDDTAFGDDGMTTTSNADGNDQIRLGGGDDFGDGGGGDDWMEGGEGNDVLFGGTGDDILHGGSVHISNANAGDEDNDYVNGEDGKDLIWGDGGDDTLLGGDGDDTIFGDRAGSQADSAGDDYIDGGNGNDSLAGDEGNDTLFGGAGADSLWGGAGDDVIDGEDGDDSISGDDGNDSLWGHDGKDSLWGGAGDDSLDGGDGDNLLIGDGGSDTLLGGAGKDSLWGGDGDDSLNGGEGENYLDGGNGNDTLIGGSAEDTLLGGDGNDILIGGAGTDYMDGGNGDDTYLLSAGESTPNAQGYVDTIQDSNGGAIVFAGTTLSGMTAEYDGSHILLNAGSDQIIVMNPAAMTYVFADGAQLNFDQLLAALHPDLTLIGDDGDNVLNGLGGNDTLFGVGGNDSLAGNAGADHLIGAEGDDTLSGGPGNDTLEGGPGNDTYLYNLGDGVDHIDDHNWGGAINTLSFGDGITPDQITLDIGSLRLDLGNGDVIHLEGFNPLDAVQSSAIQRFEFADGTVLGTAQLLARGFDFQGTGGADTIVGASTGNPDDVSVTNRIAGGRGDDLLIGGTGDDTYFFNRGDGHDRIVDSLRQASVTEGAIHTHTGGFNHLKLGPGFDSSAIALYVNDNDEATLDFGNGDRVDIGAVNNPAIYWLDFNDGTTLSITDLFNRTPFVFTGTSADERIDGTIYNDVIQGGGGKDTLAGGNGSDVYVYNLGDGADTILDNGQYAATGGDSNTLRFGDGITPDMIRVRKIGDDCVLDIGNGDSILVGSGVLADLKFHTDDTAYNPFAHCAIQQLQFADGSTIPLEDFVMQRGLDQTAPAGGGTLNGIDAWHAAISDRLESGPGSDTLKGGAGSDVYVFNRGDGADAIVDSAQGMVLDPTWHEWMANGPNTLEFGAGIAAGDIVSRLDPDTDNIVLDLGNGDSIDIGLAYDPAVQTLRFAEGTEIGVDAFLSGRVTEITGTDHADSLNGTAYPDHLVGLDGNDQLIGNGGNNVFDGGKGNDALYGGYSDDVYIYRRGDGMDTIGDTGWSKGTDAAGQPIDVALNNTLIFAPGIGADDVTPIWDGAALTLNVGPVVDGEQITDSIAVGPLLDPSIQTLSFDGVTQSMADFLASKGLAPSEGTDNADLMATFGNGQPLQGLGGDDTLYGSMRNDTLAGGAGNDLLVGGDGNDTYLYEAGDGHDRIVDQDSRRWVDYKITDEPNVLTLGAGVTPDMMRPMLNAADQTLTLEFAAIDGSIDIGPVSSPAIGMVQFADGTQLTLDEWLAQCDGIAFQGTADSDYFEGTALPDRMEGFAGNDSLYGNEGSDTLEGGQGDDRLDGGPGNDTYVFSRGDGVDTINDRSSHAVNEMIVPETNTLILRDGISPTRVDYAVDPWSGEITLDFGGGDQVKAGTVEYPAIQNIAFSSGLSISMEDLLAGKPIFTPIADGNPIADQTTQQGDAFSFAVPTDAFVDPDDHPMTFSASLADGSPLPAWLAFDAATRTFSGVPGNDDVATLALTVTASDSYTGVSVGSDFVLNVLNVNDAPTAIAPLPDQTAQAGQPFAFTLPGAPRSIVDGNFLVDPTDAGTLPQEWPTYDAILSGGAGDDTYSFGRGSGNIYLDDYDETPGNVDTVQFGQDVTPADVSVSVTQWGEPTISIIGTNDRLIIEGWDYFAEYRIERFAFADGTVWSADDLMGMISHAPTSGNDSIVGTSGNDAINALEGDDRIFGREGDDELYGGAGNDLLVGNEGRNILSGGSGNDLLGSDEQYTDAAGDLLAGGTGDDALYAGIGNDLLIGGPGADQISGDNGRNVLLFNRGDGNDQVSPYADHPDSTTRSDTLSLGGGIAYANLSFDRQDDSLQLNVGNGDSIVFQDWFIGGNTVDRLQIVADAMPDYDPASADPLLNRRIQVFDFADLATRFASALADNPSLQDWSLAPYLADDSLGGHDDAAIGGDVAWRYGHDGNLVRLDPAAVRNALADPSFGAAPQSLHTLPAQGNSGTSLFDDIDKKYGDKLTLSATQSDGSALPAWLAFDPATQTFSGTPQNTDAGHLGLRVTATDLGDLSASIDFGLDVAGNPSGGNHSPTSASPIADQTTRQGDAFSFTVPTDAFVDSDGDALAFTATMADGSPLPAWLTFDAATQTFSGVPSNDDVATLALAVTATDPGGLSVASNFTLNVLNINDAPTASPLPDQSTAQDQSWTFTVPSNTFNDIDRKYGDILTYSATLADGSPLPAWLAFDPATQTFSGTPGLNDSGDLPLIVTAIDTGGLSANASFALHVAHVDHSPASANAIADQTTRQGDAFSFAVPTDAFVDPDSDALAFTATMADGSPLPAWLAFDAATQTFSGVPGNDDVAILALAVTATDPDGLSVASNFTLNVLNVNDAPTALLQIADQSAREGSPFGFTVPAGAFADIDARYGDTLTYSATLADGSPLPTWLAFNPATQTFSGTPGLHDSGDLSLIVTATDTGGLSANAPFALHVAHVDHSPASASPIADQTTRQGDAFSFTVPTDAFVDSDGDALAFTATMADGSPLPAWLAFDAATQTFSGVPSNDDVATLALAVTATDPGGLSVASNFTLNVLNINDAPTASPLPDQSTVQDQPWTFTVPSNTFDDIDRKYGDILTYRATLADGSPLPAWLAFDPATQTLSGTPTHADVGDLNIAIVATDLAGASATDRFALKIDPLPPAACITTMTDTASVQEDGCSLAVKGNVLANDSDSKPGATLHVVDTGTRQGAFGQLKISADGSYCYALANATKAVQSLGAGETAVDRFTYQASDGTTAASGELQVTVIGQNDRPVLAIPLKDHTLKTDTWTIWQVPAGSFTDIDHNDTLTYNATLSNGAPLPAWLAFDAATQTFSGHVPKNAGGGLDIRVTASDGHGVKSVASDVFRVTIASDRQHHGGCGGTDDREIHVFDDTDCNRLWFRQCGNDLEIDVIGTSEKLRMKDWYCTTAHNEVFEDAHHRQVSGAQIDKLVQAMAAFAPPSSGQYALPQSCQQTLAPVIAANWH